MMPCFLWYGYNLAILGGVLSQPNFYNQFPKLNTDTTTGATHHYNSNIQGTVSSIYTVGGMFGALSASFYGDILGRRKTIFIASILCLIGAVLMTSSFSLGQLIVGRLILGLSAGTVSASVPVYQSEISSASKRGTHVAYTGFFITSGILIAYWIDFGCSYINSSASWRVPFAVQLILPLISGTLIFFLPESPHWLIKVGRVDEARSIMSLFVDNADPYSDPVEEQVAEIQRSLSVMQTLRFRDVLSMKDSRIFHRVLLALFSLFCSQACGVNAVTFYAPSLLAQAGISPGMAGWLAGCTEIVQPIGAYLAVLTVDSFGRRRLLMTAAIGMGISMIVMAACTAQTENKSALHAGVAFLFIINLAYSYGFLGVCFVYSAEIAPQRIRALINGFATFVTWGTNFWVVEVTPVAFASIGWRYYIVYAATNLALILPVLYFCFPETSGLHLDQIDEVFSKAKGFFDIVRVAKEVKQEGYQHEPSVIDTKEQIEEEESIN
ncbi:glucose-inactivated glycerol proton symporter STL1 [Sugiyamaella lignohabitans]|uniref:Glucose-inactivated glycerol proton symporter STL1 n=1 Tax=Sugiyamaella lignohabitans TaxID=796027 RepID=A0A167CNU3_9ASCO|nr:glucose-inactivated glycerol proton symporter STL1 [Sugiyamaella lignohabitans]ANB11934.1 glucose-inactivated glycerol proton symporter STL1 [Sugiyamaella lignohabitans]